MIEVNSVAETDPSAGLRVGWLGHKSRSIGDGLRTYSREVTAGLGDRGVEVVFVHHEPGLDDGRWSFGLDGKPVFQRRLVIAGTRSRGRLEGILREHAVDVVHLSAPFSTLDFTMPRLCHRLGVPIVVTFHVPFAAGWSRWGALAAGVYRLYAPTLAACDRVIVLGRAQQRVLTRLGVPERLITVLPNGVDIEKYSPGPSDAREAFGAERLFAFFGRIDPEKQVETLLRAFLDASPPSSLKLVVVGDGVHLSRLKQRYRDPRIVFTGAVLDERKRIAILRASDAFFLPSQVEALSLGLLEAMACGVAAAATNVGNHQEVLDGAGVLLDPRYLLRDLRSTIESLIESPALCRLLGALARERAAQLFALDAHVDGLLSIYEPLVSRPRVELAGAIG